MHKFYSICLVRDAIFQMWATKQILFWGYATIHLGMSEQDFSFFFLSTTFSCVKVLSVWDTLLDMATEIC